MQTTEKKIDESKQGEALILDTNTAKNSKKLYLESYGCAMNFSDSEVVASILSKNGYSTTRNIEESDLILLNTCSIRDKAEQTVRKRLTTFKKMKKAKPSLMVGVLGCMAERLKTALLEEEKLVDLVVGPDAYRDLPNLLQITEGGQKSVNVLLSREETYADISPVRLDNTGVTAFVSITRGCDNMCSFCVVPFTRGRERSRNPLTIVAEARDLYERGYREVTLLGQNVDSYRWNMSSKGEIKDETIPTTNFAQLMEMVALVSPLMRVRFSTSHPKDMGNDVIETIAKHANICNYIHLPVQSGNSDLLKKMNRGYTREWYLNRIAAIHRILPNATISTDIITGFCGETEEQHQDTLSLIKEVKFSAAFMYKYSERPKTLAERKYEDDIPEEIKQRRLTEIIKVQHENQLAYFEKQIGREFEVLIEKVSKKSDEEYMGRNEHSSSIIFPKGNHKVGEYVNVKITSCTKASMRGELI
ncbi:MAG: tRNA (N6-isopentenyl adenosine(37)-C2)-methylthiotransferase MiaB [Flavobacteriales bacterium]|jgi:tRNA-2-methylthio-N6-dimethylallyladenosine synthase|tara:strand:+ start:2602 stop:4026 length:1425 start_codon:yes stop_codon:yes gene_type:complete